MPRRNPARALAEEDHLAERVLYERDQRGWTNKSLAYRLTEIGCPIDQSALYKIEKSTPRRRITVEEMVGFARVFDLALDEILIPPGLVAQDHARKLARTWHDRRNAAGKANDERRLAELDLADFLLENQDAIPAVDRFLEDLWGGGRLGKKVSQQLLTEIGAARANRDALADAISNYYSPEPDKKAKR